MSSRSFRSCGMSCVMGSISWQFYWYVSVPHGRTYFILPIIETFMCSVLSLKFFLIGNILLFISNPLNHPYWQWQDGETSWNCARAPLIFASICPGVYTWVLVYILKRVNRTLQLSLSLIRLALCHWASYSNLHRFPHRCGSIRNVHLRTVVWLITKSMSYLCP